MTMTMTAMSPHMPPHVRAWVDFLATVSVRGPIPIQFEILADALGVWVLRSTMTVPDRDGGDDVGVGIPVIIQNALPDAGDTTPREIVIRQRVLGHYQHEALESIVIAGHRPFDPHDARWYSNPVADWRFNR